MKKQTIGIIIILLVAAGLVVLAQRDSQQTQDEISSSEMASTTEGDMAMPAGDNTDTSEMVVNDTSTETMPADTLPSLTLSQVAEHDNDADCYAAINGYVYDLTAWIDQHPGGDRNILRICGTDGSDAYNHEHGRNQQAKSILAGFEIGILAQ